MPSTALAMKASRARLAFAMIGLLCVAVGAGCARRAPTGVVPAQSAPNASSELRATPADHAHSEAARFFEVMAVRIAPGERAQFIAGDNRAGYYEGWTHGYRGGVGYRIGEVSLYEDRAAFVDGQRLPREAAAGETLYPYGHCVEHAGARDCLLLHAGRAALSLRLESDSAAELALEPLWSTALAGYRVEPLDDVLLLVPPTPTPADGHPDWIALSADAALRRDATPFAQGNVLPLRLGRTTPGTRLTLHIAYADSREQALQSARELAAQDSWRQQIELQHQRLSRAVLTTADTAFNRALLWAQASAHSFVVEQYGPGIWAGLPWFRDNWGRDTFIALPGTLLVSGRFDEARAVLDAFAARQQRDPASPDYGRVPNRVATNQPTIYNTVDGTPWLLRAGLEYVRYSGDVEFADRLIDLARIYIEGAQRHLDAEGLLRHADADTWMDARVYENGPAWSPRGDRAVEIQALWVTALESAAELAEARGQGSDAAHWRAQSQRARSAVLKRFVIDGRVADRLRPDGSADLARPPMP